MRPEVIRFLHADLDLHRAKAASDLAAHEYRAAERVFRRSWASLTTAEQREVNAACRALDEPETVAALSEKRA